MDFNIMDLEVQEPVRDFNDYSWTIYGVGGIGKTSLVGHLFNDPAFFQFEQGQNTLRAKKIPVPDWKTMRGYIKTLSKAYKEGKPMPFKTAVFDTDDVATKLCSDYVCSVNGWASPSDAPYGAGWSAVASEWNMSIKALEDLGIKVVHITHDGVKEFERKDGTKYNQIIPKVGQTFLGAVFDQVDFVIYMDKTIVKEEDGTETEKRMMHFRETTEYKAKSHLMYMPEHLEFGETPQETAKLVREAFEKACDLEFGEHSGKPPVEEKKVKKTEPKKETVSEKKADKKKAEPKVEPEVEESDIEYPDEDEEEQIATESREMAEAESGMSFSEVTEELNKIFTDLYKSKKKTPVELVKLCKEVTGKPKVSEITEYEDAVKLLNVVKNI